MRLHFYNKFILGMSLTSFIEEAESCMSRLTSIFAYKHTIDDQDIQNNHTPSPSISQEPEHQNWGPPVGIFLSMISIGLFIFYKSKSYYKINNIQDSVSDGSIDCEIFEATALNSVNPCTIIGDITTDSAEN